MKKRLIIFALIVFMLLLIGYFWPKISGMFVFSQVNTLESSVKDSKEVVYVERVIDGDTIEVRFNNTLQNVRLLGINTPEKNKPYYMEAKNFLIETIQNKSVLLNYDSVDIDKYGRKLRYVTISGRIVNLDIVQLGLATTFMLDNLKYKDKFLRSEEYARKNELGLWKKSTDKCVICIKLINLNPKEDYFIIKNQCEFFCNLSFWSVKDDANHFFNLSNLDGLEEKKIVSSGVWNDDSDRFFMRDAKGGLVIYYSYNSS